MAWNLGGSVAPCEKREYGRAALQVKDSQSKLFKNLQENTEVSLVYFYSFIRMKLIDFRCG